MKLHRRVAPVALATVLMAAAAMPASADARRGGKASEVRACMEAKGFTKGGERTEEWRAARTACKAEVKAARKAAREERKAARKKAREERKAALAACMQAKGFEAGAERTEAWEEARAACREEARAEREAAREAARAKFTECMGAKGYTRGEGERSEERRAAGRECAEQAGLKRGGKGQSARRGARGQRGERARGARRA